MPHHPPFASVLAAAQCGAEWAWAALYRDLQPPLLRYLRAQEPVEAEDIAADAWVDAARGVTRFAGDDSAFRCWLFTIARRRVVDLRRARARRNTNPTGLTELLDQADTTDAFMAVEDREALAWLATLPPAQAEVVLLRVVGGLDASEVAAVTGRKPGTVRVMQKRALERLARLAPFEAGTRVTK